MYGGPPSGFGLHPSKGGLARGKGMEAKYRASYTRWPLAASAVNTTNRYIITSDTTVKN
jgi:hypothetical protein